MAIIAFFEVGLNNIPVSIQLFRWIDSESLKVPLLDYKFYLFSLKVLKLNYIFYILKDTVLIEFIIYLARYVSLGLFSVFYSNHALYKTYKKEIKYFMAMYISLFFYVIFKHIAFFYILFSILTAIVILLVYIWFFTNSLRKNHPRIYERLVIETPDQKRARLDKDNEYRRQLYKVNKKEKAEKSTNYD